MPDTSPSFGDPKATRSVSVVSKCAWLAVRQCSSPGWFSDFTSSRHYSADRAVRSRSLLSAGGAIALTSIIIFTRYARTSESWSAGRRFVVLSVTLPNLGLLVGLAIRHDSRCHSGHRTKRLALCSARRQSGPVQEISSGWLHDQLNSAGRSMVAPYSEWWMISNRSAATTRSTRSSSTSPQDPPRSSTSVRCLRLGCRVTNLSTFYEQVVSEVPVAPSRTDLVPVRRSQALSRIATDAQAGRRHRRFARGSDPHFSTMGPRRRHDQAGRQRPGVLSPAAHRHQRAALHAP